MRSRGGVTTWRRDWLTEISVSQLVPDLIFMTDTGHAHPLDGTRVAPSVSRDAHKRQNALTAELETVQQQHNQGD